jgi:hypothetical protein
MHYLVSSGDCESKQEDPMRIGFASALIIASAMSSAQAASEETGRWCMINASDNARHCYFQRHEDCMKAISDGKGVCVPSEKNRGEMPEKEK